MVLRCLLVDDSLEFLEAARALLEQEGAIVVGTARTGLEARAEARRTHPDVTLVDIDLPEESGFEIVSSLTEGDLGGGPLILISAHAEEEFADMIESSPAIGFISKAQLSVGAIEHLLG